MRDVDTQHRMRLYARRAPSGEVHDIFLIQQGDALALWQESSPDEALPLPADALPAIFARYGKPLEPGLDIAAHLLRGEDDGPLQLPRKPSGHATLQRFRYMPFGWVYAADYLLWQADGAEEALAAPAPLITSALEALGRALVRQA